MARRLGGWGSLPVASALAAAFLLLLPVAGAAEDPGKVSLVSRSLLLSFEREDATGKETRHLPFYEYLSADATRINGSPVSARFYGMGRLDLADDTGSGPESGDVGAFYVEYRHPAGNAVAKAGRFFLAEGGAFETLDGAFAKATGPGGVGISLYGGKPVEQGGAVKAGDALYGGRAFFARGGAGEVGVSYLHEQGDFLEADGARTDRTLASADLWFRLLSLPAEVSGRADWNLATQGISRTRVAFRTRPVSSLDLSVAYDGYDTGDLSHGATNGAFLTETSAYRRDDDVDTISFTGSWAATADLSAEWSLKGVRHSEGSVGDAKIASVGGRYAYNGGKDSAGVDLSLCRGDRPEDRFRQGRLFATWSPGKARVTVDAVADLFEEEVVAGRPKESWLLSATASYDVTDSIRVGGDARWTDGPRLSDDLTVLARVSMGFDLPAGGSR